MNQISISDLTDNEVRLAVQKLREAGFVSEDEFFVRIIAAAMQRPSFDGLRLAIHSLTVNALKRFRLSQ